MERDERGRNCPAPTWVFCAEGMGMRGRGIHVGREERYLERRFGAEYLKYKAKVRRWL